MPVSSTSCFLCIVEKDSWCSKDCIPCAAVRALRARGWVEAGAPPASNVKCLPVHRFSTLPITPLKKKRNTTPLSTSTSPPQTSPLNPGSVLLKLHLVVLSHSPYTSLRDIPINFPVLFSRFPTISQIPAIQASAAPLHPARISHSSLILLHPFSSNLTFLIYIPLNCIKYPWYISRSSYSHLLCESITIYLTLDNSPSHAI
jgi:hypothetical protein